MDKPDESGNNQLELLLDFSKLVLEIFQYYDELNNGIINSGKRKNLVISYTKKYIDLVKSPNASFDAHKKYYLEIFEKYKRHILKADENDEWLCGANKIDIHLGHDIDKIAKKCYILKFSMCYTRAKKIREDFDKKMTGNENTDEEIKNNYEYHYQDELLYRFLLIILEIIRDDSGEDSREYKKLQRVIDNIAARACLDAESDDEQNERNANTGNKILDSLGGILGQDLTKNGMNGETLNKVIENVLSSPIINNVGTIIEGVKDAFKDGAPTDVEHLKKTMTNAIGPIIETTIEATKDMEAPPGVHVSEEGQKTFEENINAMKGMFNTDKGGSKGKQSRDEESDD